MCTDDARFFNHQEPSNVTCRVPEGSDVVEALECFATKDILPGEELSNNYKEFDADQSFDRHFGEHSA
ncbi:MAG TPA: SET domain-containing protein-lysine N-methyltransferase [Candidatus Brocadiaceae bacterium]